jgi:CPA1 family monovalent cation:H+ antiporter
VWRIGVDFVVTALGGAAVGLLVALATGKVRYHVSDEITDTAISFVTPFIAYLIAEAFDFSGVLAVVITGLAIGNRSHVVQSASSRVFERTNWRTVEFLLENTVFLLIGLQLRAVLSAARDSDLSGGRIALACVVVTLVVIVVRPIWVFPATYVPRMIPRIRERDPSPPWTYPAGISWAGMRGVVTLAAAFALPLDTAEREVLILIAFVVVGATLLVQGATLPWVLRRLHLRGPDPAEDALQAATVQQRATAAGIARLSELTSADAREEVVARVRDRSLERANAMWERLGGGDETPFQEYARLRVGMIDAERRELIRLRDQGAVPDDVLRGVIEALDVEETVLAIGRVRSVLEPRETDLLPPAASAGCAHLREVTNVPQPRTPDGCEECLAQGTLWVHLRLCLDCGHVGCCNSSVYRHADGHFADTGHPVMRSFEPGEAWRWCYVDEEIG